MAFGNFWKNLCPWLEFPRCSVHCASPPFSATLQTSPTRQTSAPMLLRRLSQLSFLPYSTTSLDQPSCCSSPRHCLIPSNLDHCPCMCLASFSSCSLFVAAFV